MEEKKIGEILRRGTNYVTILTEKNEYKKICDLREYMIEETLNNK